MTDLTRPLSDLARAALSGTDVVTLLRADARRQAMEALTDALTWPTALEIAEELEATLDAARAEAGPWQLAVKEARAVVAAEQAKITAGMADFWAEKRLHPGVGRSMPQEETPLFTELKRQLFVCEQEAVPFENRLRLIEQQIAALRAVRPASTETLTRMGLSVYDPGRKA